MKEYLISKSMRFFFLVAGTVIWLGIFFTGISAAHWLLFVPAVFFYFAAITGICPGMIFSKRVFGER